MNKNKFTMNELVDMSYDYWENEKQAEEFIRENADRVFMQRVNRNQLIYLNPFQTSSVGQLLMGLYFGINVNNLDSVGMNILGDICDGKTYGDIFESYPQIQKQFDKNFITIIKILVDQGIDINHQNKFGITPIMNILFWIREENLIEVVKFMMEMGADPFIMDYRKRNVINVCEERDEPLIPQMIKEMYPISWSRLYNNHSYNIEELMLFSNGYWQTKDEIELFKTNNQEFMNNILENNCQHLNYYFLEALETIDNSTIGKMLMCIYYGGNVNCYNKKLKNTLGALCSATRGHKEAIKKIPHYKENLSKTLYTCVNCLIECGVSINHQDKKGITPLLNLIYWLDEEIVYDTCKLLLDNGADPMIRNADGTNFIKKCKDKKFNNLYKLAQNYARIKEE